MAIDRDELARRLMATFLAEVEEHVRALNADLMALEAGPPPDRRDELIHTVFRTAHSLKGAARSVEVGLIETAAHRVEELLAPVRDGRTELGNDALQLLYAFADAIADARERLASKQDLVGSALAELLPVLEGAKCMTTPSAAPTQPPPEPTALSTATPAAARSETLIRVDPLRLDALLAQSGQLILAHSRLEDRADHLGGLRELAARWRAEWRTVEKALRKKAPLPKRAFEILERNAENLRRLERELDGVQALETEVRGLGSSVRQLDEEVRNARMLPFSEACETVARSARDLAHASRKQVELVIEGATIEVDRLIVQRLKDPLLHLVRNAIDHGVETPEQRRAAGKPERAKVTIAASIRGPMVEVVVADDGRGIDLDAVRAQAEKRGLDIPSDPRDLPSLLFAPGFSTARTITEVSGRGVGLDVVKSTVEALHGNVEVTSERGQGMAVSLTVPLTLATMRALIASAAGRLYAVPAVSVRRLLRVSATDLARVEGRDVLRLGGAPVPVVSLAEALGVRGVEPPRAEKAHVMVLAAGKREVAFVVDALISEREVVSKGLGRRLSRVRNLSGSTVLPDGSIALMLNTGELVRSALRAPVGSSVSQALASAVKKPERRKRVLIADDSVTTRALETSILEGAGYEVMSAADGAAAWELLQKRGADLVVSDVEMPRLDGVGLTEAIRGSARFKDLPVVLVTALGSDKDRARGLSAGANAYLIKSAFDQAALLATISQLL